MKRLLTYCSLAAFILLYSCGDPSPTELVYDSSTYTDDVEIEVVATDPDEIVYTNGYDSTGIVEAVPQHLSNIYVNGIKNSFENTTIYDSYYSAIFFDGDQPVNNPHGRKVGYRTRFVGRVFFDNVEAAEVPHIIHVMEPGHVRDENAGMKYEFRNRGVQNNFPFDSSILFEIRARQMRDFSTQFEIPTPEEITGKVIQSGTFAEGNARIQLNWNKSESSGKIEIIIGGVESARRDPFPLLRFKTKDDGELNLPSSIIKSIPFRKYNEIVFSFIREKLKNDSSISGLNDPFVVANSIHNIKITIQ